MIQFATSGNLNGNRYVREVLLPEIVPYLQVIPGAIFQQDNASTHIANTVRDICLPNTCKFFFGLLIRRMCHLLRRGGNWLVDVSLVNRVLQFQNTNFGCAYKQYGNDFVWSI